MLLTKLSLLWVVGPQLYRGSKTYGWEGVYTLLPDVGALQPYATSVESLVAQQFAHYYAWVKAMDNAGVEPQEFLEAGGSLLKSAWSPVRLNAIGTVESRTTDAGFPEVILAIATLVYDAADRVRREGWTVRPASAGRVFQMNGNKLLVPDFNYLSTDLFYAAVTEGVKNANVKAYLDSILEFASLEGEGSKYLAKLRSSLGDYQTTEAEILQEFPHSTAELSVDSGLRLVRWACDKLEEQVTSLSEQEDPLAVLSPKVEEV